MKDTDKVSPAMIHALGTTTPDETEEIVETLVQHWRVESIKKGLFIGIQRGVQKSEIAMRNVLQRILIKRFGEPSEAVEDALAAADLDTLVQLVDVALDTFGIDEFLTQALAMTNAQPSAQANHSNAGSD